MRAYYKALLKVWVRREIAQDAKYRWITLKNGSKVRLNKDGYVTAGFSGFVGKHISECGGVQQEQRPYKAPAKSISDYIKEAEKAHGEGNKAKVYAANNFYRENLQGTYVETYFGKSKKQQVHFTGNGREKIRGNIIGGRLTAGVVALIPTILQSKYYWRKGENTKPRKDYDGFHYFRATVTVNGRKRIMRVDVGVRKGYQRRYEAYSVALDGKSRRSKTQDFNLNPHLSANPDLVNKSLPIKCEFVNAYFEN